MGQKPSILGPKLHLKEPTSTTFGYFELECRKGTSLLAAVDQSDSDTWVRVTEVGKPKVDVVEKIRVDKTAKAIVTLRIKDRNFAPGKAYEARWFDGDGWWPTVIATVSCC